MFPSGVISDIDHGKLYLSDLNVQYLNDLKKGCCGCDILSFRCLLGIITSFDALDYTNPNSVYDDIAQDLYNKMMEIIGGYQPAMTFIVRYGFYDVLPDPNTITFLYSTQVIAGSTSFILDFTSAIFSSDKYIAFDQPTLEITKTVWINDPAFNYGTIPDSVFEAPVTLSGRDITISRAPFVAFTDNSKIKFSN